MPSTGSRKPQVPRVRAASVPEDFVVAVKASRYLTHLRRLHEPEEPVHRLMERSGSLGAKLGPVLLQLPPEPSTRRRRSREDARCFP